MKIVQINTFPYKATGNIMMSIHSRLQELGYDSYVVWGRGRKAENDHEIVMSDNIGVRFHGIYTRLTDKTGFASKRATKYLLHELDKIQPDIIHLHNIHGYYLNIELLFNYIKLHNIKVFWTLHDCWTFTGHCAYFDRVGCERWRTGCFSCPQKHTYPTSKFLDSSSWNWKRKKQLFTGRDITLITPSKWLKGLVEQSFLKEYCVEVIYNGIDCNIYHHINTDFEKKYNLAQKYVILGVASEWTERKGLKDFIQLSKMLNDKYKIVLVGLSKKQINKLPDSIIGIERTSNIEELIGIYSRANIFFNPTYEDNFPTTNIESVACQTPVITYDTGGSPEAIDSNTGYIVKQGDIQEVFRIVTSDKILKVENIRGDFTKQKMISRYIELYERKCE